MLNQINLLRTWIAAHVDDDRGASLVEYALLVALIAIVCIAAISFLAGEAGDTFSNAGSKMGAANS